MNMFFTILLEQLSADRLHLVLALMRFGVGIMMMFHGIPKITGGIETWKNLGTFMHPMGIYFLPLIWGFLGAFIESFGSLAFALGFGTRIASLCLALMMVVALVWHISRGDSYNLYSFPLTLIIIYCCFALIGGETYSLDYYLNK